MPIRLFSDLRGYSLDTFRHDIAAGIVTGIVAIPLSLGLAIATGIPPVWGLYTAVIAGGVAAIAAGSRYSVSGPAAAMIPIVAPIIATYGVDQLPAITLLAGLMLVVFGLLGFGSLIRYVPPAVAYGITAGIALVIFAGQLNAFFGLRDVPGGAHFHEKLLGTLTHLGAAHLPTVGIGLLALALLIIVPRVPVLRRIPASLIAVLVTTPLAMYVPLFSHTQTIAEAFGTIALGLPTFTLPALPDDVMALLLPALKIALFVSIESLLCAVIADKLTQTRHEPNRELAAQGIANLVAPFFLGIPATAVIARTGTSIQNGAKTRIASLIHAIVVALFLLVAAPLGSQIPLATLSAILFMTAWNISEVHHIRVLISRAPRADIIALGLTFVLTVFADLTVSVGFGLIVSALIIFRKLSTVHAEEVTASASFVNETVRHALATHPGVQFINLEGNLSMGFGSSLIDIIHLRRDTKRLIIRLREIQHIDLSGLEALDAYVDEVHRAGKEIHLTSARSGIRTACKRFGIAGKVDGVYPTTTDAIRALYPEHERRVRDIPRPGQPDRRKAA